MSAVMYIGDAIETMNKLPAGSVDLILTSPPFLALRSYLPADHPDKAKEGGGQATPGEFIDWLIDFAEACDRVLAPHGSFCVELGDTYSGKSGWDSAGDDTWSAGPDRMAATGWRSRPDKPANADGWPLAKSLSLIPELFRLSLVYGFNPLTGRQTERWRLRNVVRWVRPNPPVGALGDKFRPATSELMVFCKSAKRYFDLDAVRTENVEPGATRRVANTANNGLNDHKTFDSVIRQNPAGAPPLDWWEIPPGGYEGSHYAVFPPELCVRPVKAMSPEKVCRTCGEPSRRVTKPTEDYVAALALMNKGETNGSNKSNPARLVRGKTGLKVGIPEHSADYETVGWTDCGHDNWRPGLILDPFGGSGTVAAVATGHGRDCILIDLDARNFDLALGRVGPFMLTLGNIDETLDI